VRVLPAKSDSLPLMLASGIFTVFQGVVYAIIHLFWFLVCLSHHKWPSYESPESWSTNAASAYPGLYGFTTVASGFILYFGPPLSLWLGFWSFRPFRLKHVVLTSCAVCLCLLFWFDPTGAVLWLVD
jgi:hypothetical protein